MLCNCSHPTLALLGHDALGHTIGATLTRCGYGDASPAELGSLSDGDVLRLPLAGPAFLERFRAAYGGVRDAPRSRPRRTRLPPRPAPADRSSCGCSTELIDLGHDTLGHRVSNVFARAGLFAGSERTLAVMTDDELGWHNGVGAVATARVRERLGHPSVVVDLRSFDGGRSEPVDEVAGRDAERVG